VRYHYNLSVTSCTAPLIFYLATKRKIPGNFINNFLYKISHKSVQRESISGSAHPITQCHIPVGLCPRERVYSQCGMHLIFNLI